MVARYDQPTTDQLHQDILDLGAEFRALRREPLPPEPTANGESDMQLLSDIDQLETCRRCIVDRHPPWLGSDRTPKGAKPGQVVVSSRSQQSCPPLPEPEPCS